METDELGREPCSRPTTYRRDEVLPKYDDQSSTLGGDRKTEMALRQEGTRIIRKAIRSLTLLSPHAYSVLTSQARYRLLYRLNRPHESDFYGLTRLRLPASPVVVDAGGNIGQSIFSIYAILPNARVLTFEPNSQHFEALTRLCGRFPSLQLFPFGLSDCEETSELYWPVYRGIPLSGLASFDAAAAKEWINDQTVYGFDPARLRLESKEFLVRPLDTLAVEPDIIKIDVQGYEGNVIRGAMKTIQRTRPIIMAEDIAPDDEACRLLRPLHYVLTEYCDGKFLRVSSHISRSNQFFLPEESLDLLSSS